MNNEIEARECQTCRSIGLVLAAVIVGLISYYVEKSYPIWAAVVVFLVLLAIGMWLVNQFCGTVELEEDTSAKPKVAPKPKVSNRSNRPIEEPVLVTPKTTPKVEKPKIVVPAPMAATVSADADPVESASPAGLTAARDGKADDLKEIKGVGPKLENTLNTLGFYHFDQVAAWTDDEIAWVDDNLKGFKGRATRDNWVTQAKTLAAGGETVFSKKVNKGDVY